MSGTWGIETFFPTGNEKSTKDALKRIQAQQVYANEIKIDNIDLETQLSDIFYTLSNLEGTDTAPLLSRISVLEFCLSLNNTNNLYLGQSVNNIYIGGTGNASNPQTIVIGTENDTIVMSGTVTQVQTTNTYVNDSLITLNKGGIIGSGAGIQVEINSVQDSASFTLNGSGEWQAKHTDSSVTNLKTLDSTIGSYGTSLTSLSGALSTVSLQHWNAISELSFNTRLSLNAVAGGGSDISTLSINLYNVSTSHWSVISRLSNSVETLDFQVGMTSISLFQQSQTISNIIYMSSIHWNQISNLSYNTRLSLNAAVAGGTGGGSSNTIAYLLSKNSAFNVSIDLATLGYSYISAVSNAFAFVNASLGGIAILTPGNVGTTNIEVKTYSWKQGSATVVHASNGAFSTIGPEWNNATVIGPTNRTIYGATSTSPYSGVQLSLLSSNGFYPYHQVRLTIAANTPFSATHLMSAYHDTIEIDYGLPYNNTIGVLQVRKL